MTTIKDALKSLLPATNDTQHTTAGPLLIKAFPLNVREGTCVINIDRREGDLERSDVDAMRAAFADLAYDEVEAWLPRQGMSWLSSGVSAGVSFRIRKAAS